jgi:uncharacterized protein with von Willebrand factor type A (vWA) domain
MRAWHFKHHNEDDHSKSTFEKMFDIFKEVLLYTSGDVHEALAWMTELDKQYKLTTPEYGMSDFIEDLKKKGFLKEGKINSPGMTPTSKMELALRKSALDEIFDQLKRSKRGQHTTQFTGKGDESTSEVRPYEFGDPIEKIAISESLKNAQINHGIDDFKLEFDDLEVNESFYQSQTSTVLMIDISHSMILYGEDRITPAKKVALALSELITTRYPKDTLDIIVFGNDAWQIQIKDLPYLQVGPYHTNTVAGLSLAMDILRKRKNPNKQIMMITDGKPTCIKIGKKYYKNPYGLDKKILNRTLALAVKCRKLNIGITTFMIARDPYLVDFVDKFTKANSGKAFYSSLQGLGEFLFMDYNQNKRKRKR